MNSNSHDCLEDRRINEFSGKENFVEDRNNFENDVETLKA